VGWWRRLGRPLDQSKEKGDSKRLQSNTAQGVATAILGQALWDMFVSPTPGRGEEKVKKCEGSRDGEEVKGS